MTKFQLSEAKLGYVMHVDLYCGRDYRLQSEEGQSTSVVKHLLEFVTFKKATM